MDRRGFQRWLDGYVEAWKTYDRDKIRALFSADAVYRYSPEEPEGTKGRDAIADDWLSNKDEPNTYEAIYAPLAIEGDTFVANGITRYFNADRSQRDQYYNVYICRFNDAGECTDFTEYWMQKNEYRKAARDELVRKAKAGEIS
jgi:SnoaL-like domain